MSAVKDDKLTAKNWDNFKAFLEKFNATKEDSAKTHTFDSTNRHTLKIDLMNAE